MPRSCANPPRSAACNFVYIPFGKTLIRVTASEVPAWRRSLGGAVGADAEETLGVDILLTLCIQIVLEAFFFFFFFFEGGRSFSSVSSSSFLCSWSAFCFLLPLRAHFVLLRLPLLFLHPYYLFIVIYFSSSFSSSFS